MASNKEKLIASALKWVEKGQLDKAVKDYLKIVAEDDSDPRMWLKIGDLLVKQSKHKEAAEAYQRVALYYTEHGFYLKAVAVYKQIVKLEPRLIDINLKLAELYKQLGLVSDAMSQYEQVAAFYQDKGKTKEALAALQQVVDLEPDNVASRIKLAEQYSKEQMADKAVAEFSRAAEYLKDNDRIDDFMKVAERLLFHAPDNLGLARELAGLYVDRGDPRRALPKLQICFKANPRDLDTLALLAAAFEALGQLPKTVSVLKELARIHAEDGDITRRDETYRRILRLVPTDADAIAAVGAPRVASPALPTPPTPAPPATPPQARPAPPRLEIVEVHQSPPPIPPPRVASRREKGATGPLSAATRAQVEELEQRGGARPAPSFLDGQTDEPSADPSVDREIARILTETDVYRKYGLHTKALEHLRNAFRISPNHTEAHEKLASLFVQLGQRDEALEELWSLYQTVGSSSRGERYLQQILELKPGDPEALALLDEVSTRSPASSTQPPAMRSVSEPHHFTPAPEADPADYELGDDEVIEESAYSVELEIAPQQPAPRTPAHTAAAGGQSRVAIPVPAVERVARPWSRGVAEDVDEAEEGTNVADMGEHTAEIFGYEQSDALAMLDPSQELMIGGDEPSAAVDDREEEERLPGRTLNDLRGIVKDARPRREDDFLTQSDPTGAGGPRSLEEGLDEADYFAQQGLYVEARGVLGSLRMDFPKHPLILAKLSDLAAMEVATRSRSSRSDDPSDGDGGDSDARDGNREGEDAGSPSEFPHEDTSQVAFSGDGSSFTADGNAANDFDPPTNVGSTDDVDLADVTRALDAAEVGGPRKNVVEKGVLPEDFDTHYDLGIAYKEMGLLDDAIGEFQIVMQDTSREVLCHTMIGLCYLERGRITDAINQFKNGLYAAGIQEQEELALYYELGMAYEKLADTREALYYFDKVVKRNPRFRDVESRVSSLRGGVGDPGNPAGPSSDDIDAAFADLVVGGESS